MFRLFSIAIFFCLSSCGKENTKLKVAVAANALYAIEDIRSAFEREYGYSPEIIVGSSGKLTAQILEGAPYHIFISADTKYPETLFEKGLSVKAPETYAYGEIVLWTVSMDYISPDMLSNASVRKIAIANPDVAPYGVAAIEALHFYRLYEVVKDKLVFGENVGQVNQYINTETADAGFTAKSIVLSPELKGQGNWMELDPKAYMPIAQGVALLAESKKTRNKEATEFYDFLFSEEARRIFSKYGYKVP